MKKIKRIIPIIGIIIIFIVIKYVLIISQYKEIAGNQDYNNWTMSQRPLYSANQRIEFLIDKSKEEIELNLWWQGLTGSIEIKITDEQGNSYFNKKASQMDDKFTIDLNQGVYILDIKVSNFTGAAALGYENIVSINALSEEYSIISSNLSKGFYWDYILFIPSSIRGSNLLVVPNNTGEVSDNIDLHKEKAKELIIYKSELSEELGIPLLVPIFPRPEKHSEIYTHALDRGTIFTDIDELERLDLQLIVMIDDAKRILSEKEIAIEEKVLMSGFSASGDFVDRFTFLHPEVVKAAFIGGCDNIISYENLNGENLPYPIGVFDYKKITGKEFSIDAIANINRYIFKGSKDEGGWQVCVENSETITYTGKEYYEKFEAPQLIESLKGCDKPIYVNGDITDLEQKEILFRGYDGKILIDRFLVIKDIFHDLNMDKSKFIIYEGVGHEITDEIRQDELEFFRNILKK